MDHSTVSKAIIISQHCQRNWDLTQEIPEEDLNLLITAGTQCPSKQNIAFYKLHFITNRDMIEKVHSHTLGFVIKYQPVPKYTTNSQTLANLLVVFEEYFDIANFKDGNRNTQTRALHGIDTAENVDFNSASNQIKIDRFISTGVAAGYLNLTSSLLGYATGCCSCFDSTAIKQELGLENKPILLMGIGYNDLDRNRRLHHKTDYQFPTKSKQSIPVNFIK